MIWFLSGILLYWMIVAAERALVAVTPHEIEVLRADSTSESARRALSLATGDLSQSLASLFLARLFVQIAILVLTTAYLIRRDDVHVLLYHLSEGTHLPPLVVWGVAVLLFSALFAILLVRIQSFQTNRNAFWLFRLGTYIFFWKFIFGRLGRFKKGKITAPVEQAEALAEPSIPIVPEKRDIDLLKSIIKFRDVTVGEVIQPRSRIVAIDKMDPFPVVMETVRSSAFSRFPVFEDTLDNVTGVLYVKDLVAHLAEAEDFNWNRLVRSAPMVVPESAFVSEVLRRFKQRKRHIAIVVDEHGCTSGIVTMEDILEEVTGEIRDEFDVEQDEVPPFQRMGFHDYVFAGQTHLNDVCRIAGLAVDAFDDARGDSDTIAGLLLILMGEIPPKGREIRWNDYLFTVTDADVRRIIEVRMQITK